MAQAQAVIQLFIRPFFSTTTPTFALMVEVPNVIGNIRHKVSTRMDIPERHLRLTFQGVTLQDNDRLSDHNIVDGDTIGVMLRGEHCKPLSLSEERAGGLGGAIPVVSAVA